MTVRKLGLWVCWFVLVAIWFDTLLNLWLDGQARFIVFAALIIPCWLLLYFAEGLELAVAARVDADDSPVADPHVFFTRRQAVVILTITFVSLATVYPWVQVPWIGRLGGVFPFWFSLVFVALTTLWFCQVVPKRLAVLNPEGFLGSRHTQRFLRIINIIGALFDGPSDDLVRFLARSGGGWSATAPVAVSSCDCAICRPSVYQAWSKPSADCSCAICRP